MTLWETKRDFENWIKSDSFKKAHEKARETPREWFVAPTKLDAFESVDEDLDGVGRGSQNVRNASRGDIMADIQGQKEDQRGWIEPGDETLREAIIRHEGNRDTIYAMLQSGRLKAAQACNWQQCRQSNTWPAYADSKGLDTVGIGHLITGKETYDAYAGLTDTQVFEQFAQDIQTHLDAARSLAEDKGMQIAGNVVVQRFMTEMCFNIGAGRYRGFKNGLKKLTSAVNGDGEFTYNQAADEHLDSSWAKQVKSRAIEMTDTLRALDQA